MIYTKFGSVNFNLSVSNLLPTTAQHPDRRMAGGEGKFDYTNYDDEEISQQDILRTQEYGSFFQRRHSFLREVSLNNCKKMKKIINILILAVILATGLTSCVDYEYPPTRTQPEGGRVGTGAWDDPMTRHISSVSAVSTTDSPLPG